MADAKRFTFIAGPDDYLVGRAGQQAFDRLAGETTDEFSREIISGFTANVAEVEAAIGRLRESLQTAPLFGGRRVVWLKDVNFLADSVTGRAAGTLEAVAELQQLLERVDPAEIGVLITAAPVDRRRSFPKWCEKEADFTLAGADATDSAEALAGVLLAEAESAGVRFGPGAQERLLAQVGPNTRLLVEETRKLAAYVQDAPGRESPGRIEEADVAELTPNTAQGDFFETAEAFFSGNLKWTLAALHRHFFAGGDARPILAALQNRNRLLVQVRALVDAGELHLGRRGIEGLPRASETYAGHFAEAAQTKSAFNVFTQNPWYLGKLASQGTLPPLRRLIDQQQAFIDAFRDIIRRPREQEEVLREMAVRCLAA